ncbi:MAG: sulfite exporter TauE/SafE family protein [Nitrososphaerota archaeon]|nr:sulfite exporter TauE/SafE family protein [Nitrososphaerota archaeon]
MIEWLVYWFMFPVCIGIVSLAMMLGIDGTAILTPVVILIFPLLAVPSVSPAAAVTVGLFTEFFGFLSGLAGYRKEGLIDVKIGLRLARFAVPTIVVSSLLAQFSPALFLKLAFGVLMIGLAVYLVATAKSTVKPRKKRNSPSKTKRWSFDGRVPCPGERFCRQGLQGMGRSRRPK